MRYKIREYREKRNMSQEELAEKAGVSRTVISALETEKDYNTTVARLSKIADALGVSVRSIFLD